MFVRCEEDYAYLKNALFFLVDMYAKLLLFLDYEIAGIGEAVETSKAFLKDMVVLSSGRRVDSWSLPLGLLPVKTFSVHIIRVLRYVYKSATLFEKCRHSPSFLCSDKWRGISHNIVLETPVTLDTSAQGITMKIQQFRILILC